MLAFVVGSGALKCRLQTADLQDEPYHTPLATWFDCMFRSRFDLFQLPQGFVQPPFVPQIGQLEPS